MVSFRGQKTAWATSRSVCFRGTNFICGVPTPPPRDRGLWNEYKTQTVTDCELETALREIDVWLTWNSRPGYLPHTKNIPLIARHAGSSGLGKRRDESSKAKAPGYRPSPDHFKTVKRMLASHWAQKMLVLLSPFGEQHRLSAPECVRTRLLLSRHSVLHLSSSFKVVRVRENFIFYFTNQ